MTNNILNRTVLLTSKSCKCDIAKTALYGILLIAGMLVLPHLAHGAAVEINSNQYDYTNDGDVTITDPGSAGTLIVTFTGNTTITAGDLILGPANGYNASAEFSGGTASIAGNVFSTNDNTNTSLIIGNGNMLTIGGDLGNSGESMRVGMTVGTTLRIDGNLGSNVVMIGNLVGNTLGVGGNISTDVLMNGATLEIGTGTTGLGNVSISSASGAAKITSYNATGDLNFSAANRPIITVGEGDFTIESIDGNVNFSGYAFGSDINFSDAGALIVRANGTGKDLNFNEGVNLNTTVNSNAVTLGSTSGSVNVANDNFTYTGGTGALNINAATKVSFGGDTTITHTGTGGSSFTATGDNNTAPTISFDKNFTYTAQNGDLLVATGLIDPLTGGGLHGGDIVFGNSSTATSIAISGTGKTEIFTYDGISSNGLTNDIGGQVTFNNSLTYDGVTGGFTINAGDRIVFEKEVKIGTTAGFDFSGGTEFISRGGKIEAKEKVTIKKTDDGGFTAQTWNMGDRSGSDTDITFAKGFDYSGEDGDVVIETGIAGIHTGGDISFGDGTGATKITHNGGGSTTITTYDSASTNGGGVTFKDALAYDGTTGDFQINAGSDLTFGRDVTISFSGTGNTLLKSENGDFKSVGPFVYTNTTSGVGSNLDVSGKNVSFSGATTITQQAAGATTITATTGSIINEGSLTYSSVNGGLVMTALGNIHEKDDVTITHTGTGGSSFTATGDNNTASIIHFDKNFTYTAKDGNLLVATGLVNTVTGDGLHGGDIAFGNSSTATTIAISGTGKTEIYTYDGSSTSGLTNDTGGSVTFNNSLNYDGVTGGFTINAGSNIAFNEGVDIGSSTFSGDTEFISRGGEIKAEENVTIKKTGSGGFAAHAWSKANMGGKDITFAKGFDYSGVDGDVVIATGFAGANTGGNISFGDGTGTTNIAISGTGDTSIYTYDNSGGNGLTDPTDGKVTFKDALVYDATSGNFTINAGDDITFEQDVTLGPLGSSNFTGNVELVSRGGDIRAAENLNYAGTGALIIGNGNLTVGKELSLSDGSTLQLEFGDNKLTAGALDIDQNANLVVSNQPVANKGETITATSLISVTGSGETLDAANLRARFETGGALQGTRLVFNTNLTSMNMIINNVTLGQFATHNGLRGNIVRLGELLERTENQSPEIKSYYDWLSSTLWTYEEVIAALDLLGAGEITANGMTMPLWSPWRQTHKRLNRLDDGQNFDRSGMNAQCNNKLSHRFWFEGNFLAENYSSSDEALSYHQRRQGMTLGTDKKLGHNIIGGATFSYGRPRAYNHLAKIEADDYTLGLYGRWQMCDHLVLNGFLGYGHQEYEYTNRGTGFDASYEGDSLYASVELVRPFRYTPCMTLLPLVAVDYQQTWVDGFDENSPNQPGMRYADDDMSQVFVRVGLHSRYKRSRRVNYTTRLQYAVNLGDCYGERSAAFIAAPGMSMVFRGANAGRNLFNPGLGGEILLGCSGRTRLFCDYDFFVFDHASSHTGIFGIERTW